MVLWPSLASQPRSCVQGLPWAGLRAPLSSGHLCGALFVYTLCYSLTINDTLQMLMISRTGFLTLSLELKRVSWWCPIPTTATTSSFSLHLDSVLRWLISNMQRMHLIHFTRKDKRDNHPTSQLLFMHASSAVLDGSQLLNRYVRTGTVEWYHF